MKMQPSIVLLLDQHKGGPAVKLPGVTQAARIDTGHTSHLFHLGSVGVSEKGKAASPVPCFLRQPAIGNIHSVTVPVGQKSPVGADLEFLLPRQVTVLFMAGSGSQVLEMAVPAAQLFALTYLTRWFSFSTQSYMLAIEKSIAAAVISVSTALLFPVLLVAVLWPLGLTGIWLNFSLTSLLAGALSALVLLQKRRELGRADQPIEK